MSEKTFLMVLGPIWFNGSRTNLAQNRILKKKVAKFAKNTENPRFFEFHKVIKWLELTHNYPKRSALSQSLPKLFFMFQTQKIMKIFQKY